MNESAIWSCFAPLRRNSMGLRERLIQEEGLKLFPYKDTRGILTIGVGHNLEADPDMMMHLSKYQAEGITEQFAMSILDADILTAKKSLYVHLPWAANLDDERREILVDMTFNMGIGKLLKFEKMLYALKNDRYGDAASEMLDSAWAREVGNRATILASIMESGEDIA